jgi:cytochrome c-type biogenesis protein CcmH
MWPLIVALLLSVQTVAPLPQPAPTLSPELEAEARQLEALVIAPCCFSQQVSVHNSPAATEMRRDIRVRLAAGQQRPAILAAYTAEYGERILAEPPARGFNRVLYVLPPILGLAGIGVLFFVVRKFTRRARTSPAAEASAAAPTPAPRQTAMDDRLDEELRNLD